MTRYVCGFYFRANRSQVALIEKQRPEWMKGKMNGVGGHVDPHEVGNERVAMSREFHEETGVKIDPKRWKLFAILRGNDEDRPGGVGPFTVHFFTADWETGDAKVDSKTDEVVQMIDVAHLPRDGRNGVLPNLHWLIPLALGPRKDWPFEVNERAGR